MCPHTSICVRMLLYCVFMLLYCVLMLVYKCPHAAICVLMLLYVCPHAALYVSSCCYIRVLMLLYMCPHAAIYMCPHAGTGNQCHTQKESSTVLESDEYTPHKISSGCNTEMMIHTYICFFEVCIHLYVDFLRCVFISMYRCLYCM